MADKFFAIRHGRVLYAPGHRDLEGAMAVARLALEETPKSEIYVARVVEWVVSAELRCAGCGAAIPVGRRRGPASRWCSACQKKMKRERNRRWRAARPCADCGAPLPPPAAHGPVRKRCDACREARERARSAASWRDGGKLRRYLREEEVARARAALSGEAPPEPGGGPAGRGGRAGQGGKPGGAGGSSAGS